MRVLLVAASCALLAGCATSWPRTELYQGIPQPEGPGSNSVNPAERPTNVMLARRVQTLFPVGSREDALVRWLGVQGMTVERNTREDGNTHGRGVRYLGSWPCDRSVRVRWSATGEGLIQSITADEGDSGCL
ncbi:MAG: hypothetical protein EON85_12840 [Brevundimonas sp.]|nr:MAG: hypothetical protein EON85_12840 [Brevundimonas sp.]